MNTLRDSDQIVLTPQQQQVFSELKEFLESPDYDCFILKGYAGTGKTFLMGQLIDYLKRRHRNYVLMAPTGRAAKILSHKTNRIARTIHSTIYEYSELETLNASKKKKTIDEPTLGLFEDDDLEEVVFKFKLTVNRNPVDTVYIVDEASMVGDHITPPTELEFGSGALLQDLLAFVSYSQAQAHRVPSRFKLIFVGDPAQLPPVGANHSPALDAEYLETKHKVRVFVGTELTEVVRQKAGSGILKNAYSLRTQIKECQFYKLTLEPDLDLQPRTSETFLQTYFERCSGPHDFASIVVAYSNRLVQAYNRQIRGHFFPGRPDLQPGDRLVVMKNSYVRTRNPDTGGDEAALVLNGTMLTVLQSDPVPEIRRITLQKKGEPERVVSLRFRRAQLFLNDSNQVIDKYILENVLYSDEPQLERDEFVALIKNVSIRYQDWKKLQDDHFQAVENKYRELVEKKYHELVEKKYHELVEKKYHELVEKEYRELVEKKYHELVEKKYHELVEKEYRELVEKEYRTAIEKEIEILLKLYFFSSDPYYNALQVKFGYAITVHKAQGGEWQNVFLDCDYHGSPLNESYFRWLYTGITRASEHLFVVNTPNIGVGSQMKRVGNMPTMAAVPAPVQSALSADIPLPDSLQHAEPIRQAIYRVVVTLLDPTITIDNIQGNPYCERYYFRQNDALSIVDIHYNGKHIVTRINPLKVTPLGTMLQNRFAVLIRVPLIQEVLPAEKPFEPSFTQPFLQEFYQSIQAKIADLDIEIINVESGPYFERYTFRQGENVAHFKFFYDGKQRFTKSMPDGKVANSLLQKLLEIL